MRTYFLSHLGCFLLLLSYTISLPAQWQSSVIWQDEEGRLNYKKDTLGNRIPNFSYAGYKGGGIPIPEIPQVLTIGPVEGDNTAHIQAALDSVARLPMDDQGHRGALQLDTGRYEIQGILRISTSGVVLRGSGDRDDPSENTILVGVANTPTQRTLLIAGGGSSSRWSGRVEGTTSLVLSEKVLVGEYAIKVEHPEYYQEGDNVIINHPCTEAWLEAIEGGGAVSEGPWSVNSQPLIFNRRIESIEDSILTLDVPLYNTLDKSLSPTFLYTYDRAGILTEIGIEELRIEIETAGPEDEEHVWNALGMVQVEDAWVKNCSFLHFGLAGVYTATASRITIDNCEALDPVSIITGGRRYNFNLSTSSSQVLVKDCLASNGRHHYVSNGTSSVSGSVFLNCVSQAAYNASEGHRRWSMGLLYDNLRETEVRTSRILLGLYNRGDYGTAHGWSAAHSVAWNCNMGGAKLVVQKPPTAQNYAIGCRGLVNGNGPWPGEEGFIEGTGESMLHLPSLYLAQLDARLAGKQSVITSLAGDRGKPLWNIFPNPSEGRLVIQAPNNRPFSGKLVDLSGKVAIIFSGRESWQGSIQTIPKGVYLLEISQVGETQWIRWTKQ